MLHAIDLLNELRKVPAGNAKLEWLQAHSDDEDLKEVLTFLFDSDVVTGVSQQKLAKDVAAKPGIDDLHELMEYFKKHSSGRDEDLSKLKGYLESIPEGYRDDVRKLVSKEWNDLGIGIPTLDKVYGKGGIREVFGVQLAAKYHDNVEYVEGKEFTITEKIDGLRCVLVKRGSEVSMWSRSGKPINGYETVMKEISEAPGSYVIDGELVPRGWQSMSNKDQYKGALSGKSGRVSDKTTMVLAAFDYLEISEWDSHTGTVPYSERREKLESLEGKFGLVDVVPALYVGSDTSNIKEVHDRVKEKGGEGAMININSAYYDFRRTRNLLKVKEFFEIDLPIIGFERGKGKYSNTLGKLLLAYEGNTVRCGSGMEDSVRDHIWRNRDYYLGKMVEVQSFEESTNAQGGRSLSFPIFKNIKELER